MYFYYYYEMHSITSNAYCQEMIAKSHGIQCGFCTPGMVMSMYTLIRNNQQPSMKDIEDALGGTFIIFIVYIYNKIFFIFKNKIFFF